MIEQRVTPAEYFAMVAAAIQGACQSPTLIQPVSPWDIQTITANAMQGVDQAITQVGGVIGERE